METRQLDTHTLPLPTDVAEWCPTPGASNVLAVGTYRLDEATQRRHGAVHLFQLQSDSAFSSSAQSSTPSDSAAADLAAAAAHASVTPCLVQCAPQLDVPGVFDLRWHPRSAMPRLAAALADGTVHLLELGKPADGLQVVAAAPGGEAEGMAVSLDFSRCAGAAGEHLAVSYSSGQLQLFQVAPAGLESLGAWQAHDLEAWAAATDAWHPNLLHSGGDDAAYRLWDWRVGLDAPVWQDRKTHGAGVCCVASSPAQEYLTVTGSYDDRLRLWDLRALRRPLLVAEVNTDGGVWRAKWHPSNPCLLLAACMYNGFAVLRADGAARELSIEVTYEHGKGSLSYGADWWRGSGAVPAAGGSTAGGLVATCSFYDCKLHLWSVHTAM